MRLTTTETSLAALLLFGLAMALLARPVLADDAAPSWSLPTEYETGEPLPPEDLRESVVEWIACSGTWPESGQPGSLVVPMPATSASVTGLGVGEWCFRVAVVTVAGVQSDWSNVAVKTVAPPPKPKPPVLIQIDIQTTGTLEPTADGGLRLVVR